MKHGLLALVTAVALLGSYSRAEHGACSGSPGTTCWGRNRYIRYDAGALPVVVSVPHGGSVAPRAIPDRTGTTVTDLHTIDLARAIVRAFESRTGKSPHVVVCLLRRTKLDANRDVGEAAQGHPDAERAWAEYHGFIETAIARVRAADRRGLYIDLHGHGHEKQRVELGYLLSAAALAQDDAHLDGDPDARTSSLRAMAKSSLSALVRGKTSLGGLLGSRFPTVPSPALPSPGGDPYFAGGYSTARHTEHIAGLQIETHFTGVRDTESSRARFAAALVDAVRTFAREHLGLIM